MRDLTTVDERIFDFAYELAMRDAVNQTSYNGKGKGSKARLKGCIEAKAVVKSYILAVMNGNVADFYSVEEQVEEAFRTFNKDSTDYGTFTFGNAQKLINMMAKYMFIAAYGNVELRKRFDQCHCPMDSQLMGFAARAIYELDEEKLCEDEKQIAHSFKEKCTKQVKRRKSKKLEGEWNGGSWGRLQREYGDIPEEYQLFQNVIRILCKDEAILVALGASEILSPLEFGFCVWGSYEDEG